MAFALTASISGATLEKLSVEEMAQKATLIIRGRVSGCAGEAQGSIIYTRCRVSVTERWKGAVGGETTFIVPGGSANGLIQTFTGTPKFSRGEEYVLFLWAGRSGTNQVIGLTQGVFDLKPQSTGQALARRAASSELMLDNSGRPVQDEGIQLRVSDLHARVNKALLGGAGK